MLWTEFKYENKQRAITKKISKQQLRSMCTALPWMRFICPQNFIVLEIRIQTKFKYENKQEGHDGPGSITCVIFPTNESLFLWFQLVTPGSACFNPKGHHMNEIDKGLQGDATYQN